jgi:alpha-1,6-mannosyltransferase
MKIVDVSAFYAPRGGGVRTYVDHKLRIGGDHGHEIVIIAPGRWDHVKHRPNGGRIIHLASPTLPLDKRHRYFAGAAAVHAVLDAERPDMIEASSPWRTASIVADWREDAPRALIMHADPLAAYPYRWFGGVAGRDAIDRQFQWFWNHLRRAAAGFDMVVCANEHFSGRLRRGSVPGVRTIAMGVESGLFSPERRNEAVRRDLLGRCALGPDATLLVGIGRHSAEKRWPMGLHRPAALVLIGAGRDQPKIMRHIAGNPHIHLLAPIADRATLATVMASADTLVHGCEAETFGLVVAEAAASGLPLIVPTEGGEADLALPACAELYEPSDPSAAAEAILRMLRRDRSVLRQAAVASAHGARTMDTHFEELFAAYGDLRRHERQAA